MSSRVLTLIAAALLTAAPAFAQRSAALVARERRLDSVVSYRNRVSALLKALDDSATRSRSRLDTVSVGPMPLFVAPKFRERAERAMRAAAAYADSIAPSLRLRSPNAIVLRQAKVQSGDTAVLSIFFTKTGREAEKTWGFVNDSILTMWFRDEVLSEINRKASGSLHEWVGYVSPDTVSGTAWLRMRVDLVSQNAVVAHRCYDGDLAACSITLGLTKVADPVTQWFDSTGRRREVAMMANHGWFRRGDEGSTDRCLRGSDAACVDVMRAIRALGRLSTLEQNSGLARLAVQVGGKGAYDRLLTADGPPPVLLAIAAGIPVDSLLHLWQQRVHDTRMPSQDMTLGIAMASLSWILVCGALSLRSSRWR